MAMTSPAKTVVIGGGTGFIGSAIERLLSIKGYNVVVVSRNYDVNQVEVERKTHITWSDLESAGLPENTTAVVNVAGQNLLDPRRHWTAGFKQNVWASRVNTTRYLAEAIKRADVKPNVFVTISGVGYYAPSDSIEYTEDSLGGDFDFLSKLCTEWEAASTVDPKGSVRTVNIRSGVVLGRQGGMCAQLFMPFFFGLGGPVGTGTQPMSWIHITDIANLFIHAIENDKVSGLLNGVAPQIITNGQFTKAYAQALMRPSFLPWPTSLINFIFEEERAKMITEGQKVIPKKALETGFTYQFPDIKSAAKDFGKVFYFYKFK